MVVEQVEASVAHTLVVARGDMPADKVKFQATFQATGCCNAYPNTAVWTGTDSAIWEDMFDTCLANQLDSPTDEEKSFCGCGEGHTFSCIKQTSWTLTTAHSTSGV